MSQCGLRIDKNVEEAFSFCFIRDMTLSIILKSLLISLIQIFLHSEEEYWSADLCSSHQLNLKLTGIYTFLIDYSLLLCVKMLRMDTLNKQSKF